MSTETESEESGAVRIELIEVDSNGQPAAPEQVPNDGGEDLALELALAAETDVAMATWSVGDSEMAAEQGTESGPHTPLFRTTTQEARANEIEPETPTKEAEATQAIITLWINDVGHRSVEFAA